MMLKPQKIESLCSKIISFSILAKRTTREVLKMILSLLQPDNTASVLVRREGFSRQKQDLYLLPIVISDGGVPPLSSTNTLSIRVCGCDGSGSLLSCNAEAYVLNAGLSTGALIAILACIVILLGEKCSFPAASLRLC